MKTLNEIITLRQHKYDEDRENTSFTEFWQGYMEGWYWAYKDLLEILEYNGFNLNAVVIDNKKEERRCETCYANDMEHDEVDNPCWNCKGDYSEWMQKND